MLHRLLLSAIVCFFSFHPLTAQIAVNTDNSDPDASAMLDIKSTDKGILIPRMTTAQRTLISNPAIGLLVFDTDTKSFWFNETAGWVELVSGNVKTVADDDGDTKIQVEESADEDVIRFDTEGTEHFVMEGGRLDILNTGGSVFLGDNAGLKDDLTNNQNVFIGTSAGTDNTTGQENIGIGFLALNSNTTGNFNSIIGHSAMNKGSTSRNSGLGYEILRDNVSGLENAALGFKALVGNTTGSGNVGIGSNAGKFNQGGSNNVFIGSLAGVGGTGSDKSNNVMVGAQSGRNNDDGSGNVFLGFQSGQDETGSNKLYIENSGSAAPLIYGEFDNDLIRINGTLDINNAFSFPTTDGTAGQILETDGSGNLSWIDKNSIRDADDDTKIQVEKIADEDMVRIDIAGNELFRFNENAGGDAQFQPLGPRSNTFIGLTAGKENTAGSDNTFIGHSAGKTHQSGNRNVYIGKRAGQNHTSGNRNIFIGNDSGLNNNGNDNIFIGNGAGGNETGANKLYIEPSSSSTPLLYGEFDNDLIRINGTLDINNAFSFPTTDGTVGQILETDGLGNLSWIGKNIIQDADNDTKIQVEESADEDILRFDIGGTEHIILKDNGAGFPVMEFPNNNLLQINGEMEITEDILVGNSISPANLWVIGTSRTSLTNGTTGYVELSNDADNGYLDYEPFFSGAGNFKIRVDGINVLHFKKDGKLGIGTAPTSNQLTVGGDSDFNGDITVGGNSDFSGDIEFGTSDHKPVAYDRKILMVGGKVFAGGGLAPQVTSSSYIASTARTATGQYTVTFNSGIFSTRPVITVTAFHDGTNVNRFAVIDSVNLSSGIVTLLVEIRNSNGELRDGPFNFIAIGEE